MRHIGKAKGRVIRWDAERKFGFSTIDFELRGDDFERVSKGEDAFIHHRDINMGGVRKLIPGQVLEFDMYRGHKGITAKEVNIVGDAYDSEGDINGNL